MKKRGFTLIELLAVIVVLAVIALIATPMVLNTIEEARRGAAVESVNAILSAAETKYMSSMITGNQVSRYDFPETTLEYKGTRPEEGTIIIDKNGNTSIIAKVNGYCVRKRFGEGSPEVIDAEECTIEDSELEATSNYTEAILNGADPVISGNLVAVTIENDGTVKKANMKQAWYNYGNKVWANAVILKDETVTYEVNTVIPEENIESYFVWIPRYRYQLFYEDNYAEVINSKTTEINAKPINIIFENKNTPVSNGDENGEWLTHPSFTTFDTNGIWVGKFETGYLGATSKGEAQTNTNISDVSKVIIKPNVYSWRGINVLNIFTTSLAYNASLNSHMMKNTEWGAVAYLSHSEYGINKEVNVNNNSSNLTGYSSTDEANQAIFPGTTGTTDNITLAYNTPTGYKASTTGNISGVYDMSGGTQEYVAAYIDGIYKDSGFTADTIGQYDAKYFDIYPSDSVVTSYSNRILGDATGEMGPIYYYPDEDANARYHNNWYSDTSYFVESEQPWFYRSGYYNAGLIAGQFNFSIYTGGNVSSIGFRIVLAF